jgi:hypothetical protein
MLDIFISDGFNRYSIRLGDGQLFQKYNLNGVQLIQDAGELRLIIPAVISEPLKPRDIIAEYPYFTQKLKEIAELSDEQLIKSLELLEGICNHCFIADSDCVCDKV